jgi:hypothetical protein
MKVTFVIISVSDRVDQLNLLIQSIRRYSKFDSYDLSILFQDYMGNSDQISKTYGIDNMFIYPERLGCHGARIELLRRIKGKDYDYFINLDDDMEVTEQTNYQPCIEKCKDPRTGFILTNWARNRKLHDQKIPKMKEVFLKQIMVYNGGGQVYGKALASIMASMEIVKATFDNAWALTAYLQGYQNYAYKGSLAIHRICTSGGMRSFMENEEHELTYENLINYKTVKNPRGKGRDICIPMDSDLKPIVRLIHKQNRIKKFGK